MVKFAYVEKLTLSSKNKEQLAAINKIIEEYRQQGYTLSLRQLYYQLVSRDVVPNQQKEYAKLSTLLTKGRMSGIVDWDAIEDRLRKPYIPYWVSGMAEAIRDTIEQYRINRMKGQATYLEVWVEKDALSEVLKRSTEPYHVRVMVNRGYSSTSAMHDAYKRFEEAILEEREVKVVVLYLGDHDPSGMDMVRDIADRVKQFFWGKRIQDVEEDEGEFNEWFEKHFEIQRIALNMEQIRRYNPPPNPAKFSDPRATGYVEKYGKQSWEVDALPPEVLHKLVQKHINENIDVDLFNSVVAGEEQDKAKLKKILSQIKE